MYIFACMYSLLPNLGHALSRNVTVSGAKNISTLSQTQKSVSSFYHPHLYCRQSGSQFLFPIENEVSRAIPIGYVDMS